MNNTKLAYIAAAIARNRRAMRRYEAVYNAAAIQQHEDVARVNGAPPVRYFAQVNVGSCIAQIISDARQINA